MIRDAVVYFVLSVGKVSAQLRSCTLIGWTSFDESAPLILTITTDQCHLGLLVVEHKLSTRPANIWQNIWWCYTQKAFIPPSHFIERTTHPTALGIFWDDPVLCRLLNLNVCTWPIMGVSSGFYASLGSQFFCDSSWSKKWLIMPQTNTGIMPQIAWRYMMW